MKREEVKLDASMFTSKRAMAREVVEILERFGYNVTVIGDEEAAKHLRIELEDRVTLGRVKLKVTQ